MQMVFAGVLAALMALAPGADGRWATSPCRGPVKSGRGELVAGNPPIAKGWPRVTGDCVC
jgi:hypothetical protein